MIPSEVKRWAAFGSGIGIQIAGPHGSESLHVAAARVRPNGARLLEKLSLENFAHQPAGVWGTEYGAFVRKLDLRHVAATVLLPRQDVIARQIALPGVSDKDLAAAIAFQMDGLHPYPEDDVVSSWARLPGTATVLVAIARRAAIERYAELFSEAGVKIGAFTCSSAAIYSALRLLRTPPSELLAAERVDGHVEYYGESPARTLFSASFDVDDPRGTALACAELRVDQATEARPLDQVLGAAPALPFAAAMASACPWLAISVNLLPAEMRQNSSRAIWVPSAIAGVLVLGAAIAMSATPAFENHRYERSLQSEIHKIEKQAQRSAQLDRDADAARRKTLLLDDFRHRAKADMDVLAELTKILPPPAWLNSIEISRNQVTIAGEAEQAPALLKVIDSSPLFESSEFVMPPVRQGLVEGFRIRTLREAGR
ncbi:MAG TPA: PilN domain-containing protein [Bryobacteraceae bacterium]|nr:PilN domain-containing protein [Bryobacteraceae bacterium]